ncbi:MAG: membrane integrity-associated transporter subunit PqiC [Gammaproteobacteria bacterium]|nr:membrane integrity-associated transporter subunit PqiC [Gammaproteobacteria bacterium]MCP5458298.1 membrane integrity-associated transporter subunit PqiC [Gammaproteobacteria bacterium]
MTVLRCVVVAGFILLAAACSLGKPIPQATTYVVEPPPPASVLPHRAQTLRMGRVRVAPAFAGQPLVVRVDGTRYSADFYNTFIAEPAGLFGARMAEWLAQSGPFDTVLQPDSTTPAAYALEAVVTELYGDFSPGHPPVAVLTIQFTLIDLQGLTPQARLERTIGRRIELAEATPNALVLGYGQALGEILTELAPQLSPVR